MQKSMIIDLILSSMIKRRLDGADYGVAIVSEGIFHALDDEEIKNCGITFTYDAHGHFITFHCFPVAPGPLVSRLTPPSSGAL